ENGSRREVKGAYVINGNEIKFKLDRFDASKPLVIDPILSYSTLLGSTSSDTGFGIAVDSQGNAYVTGTTDGINFPTTSGAFKTTSNNSGAFVTKLNATGTALIYSSYLSGVDGSTSGAAIAVDSSGNAHVTGRTSGADFPSVNGLKTSSNFFKTTDAAANWNNQNSGLAGTVFSLAVAPSAPNTIYAATGSGFYRSTDGGSTWTKITTTGLTSNFINVMAVDPSNASIVYVGSFSGLLKTTDAGSNWTAINASPLFGSTVNAIVFDPSTPSTIYLGTASGAFKSADSGATWIAQNNFGVPGTPSVRAFAIDPTAPLTVYAGTSNNGLFKSTNGGGVWTAMNNGMGGPNPTNINAIVIDPANTSTIYTGHGSSSFNGGINKSTNGGTSWSPLTNGVPNRGVIAMVATSSAVYAAINSAGIIKTTNGGTNWTTNENGLWTPFVNSLVKHPTNASILYAGTNGSGNADAFVTKFNASGSGLLFSTLVGGSNVEGGNGIAVDGGGNISVVGQTNSTNFPLANAVKSTITFNGNCGTGFVTKLNPAVPAYTFSTYLGGSECDVANSVATDSSGNVYVTGRTGSTDFPTANAFQPAFAGPQFNGDAFVTKLTPNGAFVYSTYLGGSSNSDTGLGIAADSSGNAYVTGLTFSTNFPTLNASQPNTLGSNGDAFVTKLNSQGSALIFSTYLGGSGNDTARGIAVDSANNVYVTGSTDSLEFPLVAGALRTRSPMYKSVDGAANWSNDNYGFGIAGSSSFSGTTVTGLVINPAEPSTVYAGTGIGVFKTTNGGRTWTVMNNGLTSRNVAAIVINPSTPATLYVLVTDFTSNSGVYKTTDGGATWNRRSNGLIGNEFHSLAIDPVTPNTLFVGVGCCVSGSRVYKTTDGADNWGPIGTTPPAVPRTIVVDPLNHTTVYAADGANPGAVYKSINGGTTWQPLGSAVSFARSLSVSPHTAGVVYAGTDQAIFKSIDGGSSWTSFTTKAGKIVF
ncbi:MAG TPA: SBBP repeat-containing protein, partial [Pyrinomonadaceae bacterium]|nr:SBBP repeat-containing protein [Pyrinomonadaceae bacterium]